MTKTIIKGHYIGELPTLYEYKVVCRNQQLVIAGIATDKEPILFTINDNLELVSLPLDASEGLKK